VDRDVEARDPIEIARERAKPLRHNAQRQLMFYRLVVDLRNAIEQMQARHRRLEDPEHRWWGFGDLRPPKGDDRRWPGDDGLAGSRVPRRPPDGAGEVRVELDEPSEDVLLRWVRATGGDHPTSHLPGDIPEH
jgi:hypothetical protein